VSQAHAGISLEPQQRAKILSHSFQKQLHLKRLEQASEVQKKKADESRLKTEKILAESKECEAKLMEVMELPAGTEWSNEIAKSATLEHFHNSKEALYSNHLPPPGKPMIKK